MAIRFTVWPESPFPQPVRNCTLPPYRPMKLFVPTVLVAALAACGGGGGGDDSGTTSRAAGIPTSAAGATGDITTTNYATVALQVRDVLSLSADAADAVSPVGTGGTSGAARAKVHAASSTVFSSASSVLGRKSIQSAAGTSSILAVSTSTQACTGGGSVTATFDDADNNQDVSAGDSITIAASNCKEDGETLNGSATVTIGSFSDTRMALAMQFSAMSVSDVSISGGASVTMDFNGYDFSGQLTFTNITVTKAGAPTVQLSFTQTASYKDATGILSTSTQGGILIGSDGYWMQQVSPFQTYYYATYPHTGSLSVVDKDGDRVVGLATPTGMRYEFYRAGNTSGTPDAVTEVPNA